MYYALIIIVIMSGSGKAAAIHETKFSSLALCQQASQQVQKLVVDDSLEFIRTTCVKTDQ